MISRIDAKVEKALRTAMGHVAKAEADQIEPALAVLNEDERKQALGLAIMVAGYVLIDACGTRWPTDASTRGLAEDLATTGTTAQRLGLDAGEVYTYLSRSVLGGESPADVFADERAADRLTVIVAQRAVVGYMPKDMDLWSDYLDRIETALEVSIAMDATLLPAAVLRAYLPDMYEV
jgi:hypothetical protein